MGTITVQNQLDFFSKGNSFFLCLQVLSDGKKYISEDWIKTIFDVINRAKVDFLRDAKLQVYDGDDDKEIAVLMKGEKMAVSIGDKTYIPTRQSNDSIEYSLDGTNVDLIVTMVERNDYSSLRIRTESDLDTMISEARSFDFILNLTQLQSKYVRIEFDKYNSRLNLIPESGNKNEIFVLNIIENSEELLFVKEEKNFRAIWNLDRRELSFFQVPYEEVNLNWSLSFIYS